MILRYVQISSDRTSESPGTFFKFSFQIVNDSRKVPRKALQKLVQFVPAGLRVLVVTCLAYCQDISVLYRGILDSRVPEPHQDSGYVDQG